LQQQLLLSCLVRAQHSRRKVRTYVNSVFGYQGQSYGDLGLINGLSSRYWSSNEFGIEGNVYYGANTWKYVGGGYDDQDLLAGAVKLMYVPVVKANSRFYVGAEGSLGRQSFSDNTGYDS